MRRNQPVGASCRAQRGTPAATPPARRTRPVPSGRSRSAGLRADTRMVSPRRIGVLVGVLVSALVSVLSAARSVAAQAPAGVQVEARAEYIEARTSTLQGGAGLNVPAGRYVRLGTVVAGGVAIRGGAARGAARADLLARFLLDPFRESRVGLYGIGGISALYDGFEETRARLMLGVGVETRPRGRHVLAGELALGGGVRIAFVVRRARRSGR